MAKEKREESSFGLPRLEEEVLAFWERHHIFEKSVRLRLKAKRFVFFEGPPSANAPPGVHHVLARVFKDIVCRYKTMKGYLVERKAGWDTHGLPIEIAVERAIGINSKKEIESYGIEKFNKKARALVWKYKKEWDEITKRIGFWLDLDDPYITYETPYIESLWWIIKQIWKQGRLYRDYKVVPYCPRCGTALSSHEVAQEYQKINEDSITVRFPVRGDERACFLAWTTTPWTLPANVALAVHPDLIYSKIELPDGSIGIVARELRDRVAPGAKEIGQISGKLLLGMEYEPVFSFIKPDKPAFRIIEGAFVSAEEGTGIVHIAPAFGIDDMEAGRKNDLPVLLTVSEEGTFLPDIEPWAGMFVKKADPLIIKDLQKRHYIYSVEKYEHDYPFCWRCKTPLLYYPRRSWFIRMQDLRQSLVQNNKEISWEPEHLKEGRFGEWLLDAKDWTFSRERYWGTALPIWNCEKCGQEVCIGSVAELGKYRPRAGNCFFFLRHGESVKNRKGIAVCYPEKGKYPLTPNGRKQIKALLPKLQRAGMHLIVASDLLRTRETAEIIGRALGVPVLFDVHLREIDLGKCNGKNLKDTHALFSHMKETERFSKGFPGGENWRDVRKRMVSGIMRLEKKYSGKNILIVSHGDPLWMLAGALKGLTERNSIDSKKNPYPKMGSLKEIAVPHVSFDHEGEVNLHRPYIDALSLKCDRFGCDGTLRRVSDVIDGWFDSGAMPFAQWHYPFDAESRRKIDDNMYFPADFISEGVDQTRGWFYTLLAVSTLLGKGAPYRNVISVGHVLDVKGEAMHKSKGNVIFPQDIIRRFGIDALRWYYFTINSAGEPKRFDEKELMSRERRFLATLWHTFLFYETYVHRKPKETKDKTPLDSWMYLRIKEVSEKIQASLDAYDIPTSARSLDLLLDDISNWYVRRSRIMLQRPASRTEYNRAAWHLQNVLATFVKLSAPFIPLLSEAIYQRLKFSKKESVHCAQYPSFTVSKNEEGELRAMEEVRQIVSLGLAARKKSGIKVRQPLAECVIAGAASGRSMQYERLICDELNVKSATWTSEKPESRHAFACEEAHSLWVGLDTTLNSALKEEGEIREFIRQIQNIRKRHHLRPKERITCGFTHHSSDASFLIEKWKKVIEEETRISLRQADSFRKRGGRREMCRIQDKEIPVIFYIS